MAQNGLVSGASSPSPSVRSQKQLENEGNNSILIGGQWRKIDRLSPLGNLLILGAEAYKNGGDVLKTAAGGVKSLSEQSFLKGLSGALQAFSDPERSGSTFIENAAASSIPTILSDIAGGVDTYDRMADDAQTKFMKRIPGVRESLPANVNALGLPVKNEGGLMGRLSDPFQSKTPSDDSLVNELKRVGYNLNKVDTELNKQKLTPDEWREYQKRAGQYIRETLPKVIGTNTYRNSNTDRQHDMIDAAVKSAKTRAREEMKRELKAGNKFSSSDVSAAEKSSYASSDDAPKDILGRTGLYAQGFATDPGNTWKALTTEEQLRKITGDSAILERKQFINPGGTGMQVDHTIPLSLGGDNADSNLAWYSPEVKAGKDRLEKQLYAQLRDREITKAEAQRQIRAWVEANGAGTPYQTGSTPTGQQSMPATAPQGQPLENYSYVDPQTGKLKNIPLNREMYQPRLSGNATLDKLELAKQKTSIGTRITDIQNLYNQGQIDPATAARQIEELQALQKAISSKVKVRKAKKLKIKRGKVPSFKKLAVKRIKTKKVKLTKIKLNSPKQPKDKPVQLSMAA
jgi:hypothetical protein